MWYQGMECFMGFGQWFSGHRSIVIALNVIIIAALVALVFRYCKHSGLAPSISLDVRDTLNILEKRLANGEINEKEYHQIRDILAR